MKKIMHNTDVQNQFMPKPNYAKTISGLSVCVMSKITPVTLFQYFNSKNDNPFNHLR